MDTRLFFVTDSKEDNEELFETLFGARHHFNQMKKGTGRRIRICIVKNAFREGEGWNYDDQADTFNTALIYAQEDK